MSKQTFEGLVEELARRVDHAQEGSVVEDTGRTKCGRAAGSKWP